MTEKNFSIQVLDKSISRTSFNCGISTLNDYFHKRAGQDSRKYVAVTYTLIDVETEKVAGYYTLSANAVEFVSLPERDRKKLLAYPNLPATLIGRLAIDNDYQKRGLGEFLLIDALKRAYKASLSIASFAVLVDAINEQAKRFYQKYGFLDLSDYKQRLFLPMSVVSKL